MTNFESVNHFMRTMRQEVKSLPEFPNREVQAFRVDLINEEFTELKDALTAGDMVEVADAIGDILFVTYGAASAFGIDADAVFAEVMRSNMTKLGADGQPIFRADGKVMKGPAYERPQIAQVLETQLPI